MPRRRKNKSRNNAGSGAVPALSATPAAPAPAASGKKKRKRKVASVSPYIHRPVTVYGAGAVEGSLMMTSTDYLGGYTSTGAAWNGGGFPIRPTLFAGPAKHVQSFDKWRFGGGTVSFSPNGGSTAPGLIFMKWGPDPVSPAPTGPEGFFRGGHSGWGPAGFPLHFSVPAFRPGRPRECDPDGATSDDNAWGRVNVYGQGVNAGTGGVITLTATWVFEAPE